MEKKDFYLNLLEEILDERMRQDALPQRTRNNRAWTGKLWENILEVMMSTREGLSWEIIRGRLIQCVAVIFAWIEDKDTPQEGRK